MKKYFHQLSLLLWKNFLIKKRSIVVFAFELTVPLVLFLIMVAIRVKQHARPVDVSHFDAWPLPSAGFIPIMQSFCSPKYGIRNQYGFLEYPNSTVKQMIEQIDKLSNQNWTFTSLLNQDLIQLIANTPSTTTTTTTNSTIEQIFKDHRNESLSKLFNLTSTPSLVRSVRLDYYLLFKHVNQTRRFDELKSQHDFQFDSSKICSSSSPANLNFILTNNALDLRAYACNLTQTNNQTVNNLLNVDYFNEVIVNLFNRAFDEQENTKKTSNISLDSIERVINDLAELSEHFPHGLCDADKIMREGDAHKSHRPESIMSDTREVNYDSSLKENHGFLGIWTNMQKTFCGQVQSHHPATNSSTTSSDLNLSKDQIKSLSLLINVVYSNPVILFSPNTSVIRSGLIGRANKTFELLNEINLFSRKWLDQSAQLISYFNSSNTSRSNDIINKLEVINSAACSWLSIMSGVNLDVFKGFASEDDLVDYFLNKAYFNNQTVIASLVFNISNQTSRLDPHIAYKIRQNASFTYTTKKIRERYWYPSPRDWDYYYYLFGFTWLQDLIDRAIIDYHSNATILEPGSYFQQMPYPCYTYDNFLQMIQHVMPLCLSVSFVYSVSMLTQTIVIEKELRLKEVMKIMGLNNSCHLLAWFITYFLQFSFIMIIVTLVLHFGKILTHSNPFLIFFLLELYAIATICFSFLVGSLYSKAKLAAACAGILYFLSYVPCMYISIREDVAMDIIPSWKKTLAALLSTSAFGMASKYIAFYENDGAGIQWHNMDKSPLESDQYTCYQCVRVMIFDCFLYWTLAWYIENVRPSYGIPLKWYFPFKVSYWLGNETPDSSSWFNLFKPKLSHTEPDQARLLNESNTTKRGIASATKRTSKTKYLFEQEPLNLKVGVAIHNLTKQYGDAKLAVDNLSINFYESQITSFLGHNGAGKSTTMSMLTGLIPATSGHALIYDKDIRTHINEVRKNLGWCPQHNVLFSMLTVEEHLWFYGQLKQMNPKSIQNLIENMLRDTGLTKKRNNLIHTLSGGMQRKLSVAIAFVGDANLVILDEPTAGVDPYARRAIWDLLLKYKTGRTIVLSTHHMDEAELLGDRIGIISEGRLQCCGTALFLKNALGEGNNLTIVKDMAKINAELEAHSSEAQIISLEQLTSDFMKKNAEILTDFIRGYIPSAYLRDETLREYNFIIPLSERSNPKYWTLFNALEEEKSRLNIDSYGIHDVSLEEIFIKAAQIKRVDEMSEKIATSDDEESESSNEAKKSLYDLDYIYADLEIGYRFYLKQVLAMFVKRYLYNKRNWISLLTQIILPALFICVAMTVALAAPGFFDLPKIELTPAQYYPLTKPEGIFVPFSHSTQPKSCSPNSQPTTGGGSASSREIVNTLTFITGIASTCCLNTANLTLKDLFSPKLNPNYFGFTESCSTVFNPNPDLNIKYFPLTNNKAKFHTTNTTQNYFPKCECSRDYSGFECSDLYAEPPAFKLTTHETLLNISGSNETDYYLYTTDLFRLKRYGGLSFDNENCSHDAPLLSDSLQQLDLIRNLATNRKSRVWYNNKGFHAMPTFLSVMNNAILRGNIKKTLQEGLKLNDIDSDLEASRYGITVFNHPMNQTNNYLSTEYLLEGSDVLISIFTIVAMSFVNASFVLFLVYERSIKSLHLQFLMGLNPFLYWLTNFIWDMLNYLLPASCVIIILKIFNVPAYVEGANYPAVILLFLLYGFSVSPLMYPMSFWFKEPSNAYIFLIVINLFTGITCVESSFLFQVFSFDKDLKLVYDIMKSLFLIFPPYCLGRGLIDIAYNDYYNTFYSKTGQFNKIRSPFEWDITARNLVAMSCVGVISWVFTLLLEYDFFKLKWLIKIKRATNKKDSSGDLTALRLKEDVDVHAERKRIETLFKSNLNNDQLVLKNLRKVYFKKTQFSVTKLGRKVLNYFRKYKIIEKKDANEFVAVSGLTLGVPQGECFGLLGVNGAGKTTTFKMLTTDLEPSEGSIFIRKNDYVYTDALANKKTYWSQIGYCPQFDALYDELTPADHIRLFARVKGVKTKYENSLCESLLERLDLLKYANKPVGSLSLGNKRKLSTALSFVGNPRIVLLDEPTSGMDPVSRRHLWQEIINLTRVKNCAVLLTSHSMEEVQVLSTRLAIMVEGKFKCMGSVQHLKTKFGDGYTLTVKIKDMPKHLSEHDDDTTCSIRNKYILSILDALKENISADCKLKKRHFNNIYQFELPCSHTKESFDIGSVYRLIELNKLRFNLVDYSLSQNTLDNVFVNFVKEQTQTAKSRASLGDDNNDDDDLIDQNYQDDSIETNTSCGSSAKTSSIQFPIHDNDDLLINLNSANSADNTRRANFDLTSELNDQHNLLNNFSNMELMEIVEDDYC